MKIILKANLLLLSIMFFNVSYAQSYDSYYYGDHYYPNSYPQYQQQDYGYRANNSYQDNNYYGNNYNQPHQEYYGGETPQMFDWDFRESWRDHKEAFYSGETQAGAYRKAHPTGKGGIGYDADPTYLQMKNDYEKLREENRQYVAENNRLANRDSSENQEYYSRGGGGRSQKGRASRESRQGGGSYQNYQINQPNYNNNEYQNQW